MKKVMTIVATIGMLVAQQANALGLSAGKTDSGKPTFDKSTSVVQLNIGLGSAIGIPVQASYEKAVTDNIGVGAVVGFASRSENLVSYKYSYTYLLFGVRGNYHYQFIDKLDTYAGLTLGYNRASVSVTPAFTGNIASASAPIFAGQVGGRYYFSEKLAGSVELGYGIAYANIGIAYKLK